MDVSGITQGFVEFNLAPVPQVPRDPHKARIGEPYNNPVRSACTRFEGANMFNPEWNPKDVKQVGCAVHAHCWLLVDRVIGMELLDAHLAIFVKAVVRFWVQHPEICMVLPIYCDDFEREQDLWDLQLSFSEQVEAALFHVEKPGDYTRNSIYN